MWLLLLRWRPLMHGMIDATRIDIQRLHYQIESRHFPACSAIFICYLLSVVSFNATSIVLAALFACDPIPHQRKSTLALHCRQWTLHIGMLNGNNGPQDEHLHHDQQQLKSRCFTVQTSQGMFWMSLGARAADALDRDSNFAAQENARHPPKVCPACAMHATIRILLHHVGFGLCPIRCIQAHLCIGSHRRAMHSMGAWVLSPCSEIMCSSGLTWLPC